MNIRIQIHLPQHIQLPCFINRHTKKPISSHGFNIFSWDLDAVGGDGVTLGRSWGEEKHRQDQEAIIQFPDSGRAKDLAPVSHTAVCLFGARNNLKLANGSMGNDTSRTIYCQDKERKRYESPEPLPPKQNQFRALYRGDIIFIRAAQNNWIYVEILEGPVHKDDTPKGANSPSDQETHIASIDAFLGNKNVLKDAAAAVLNMNSSVRERMQMQARLVASVKKVYQAFRELCPQVKGKENQACIIYDVSANIHTMSEQWSNIKRNIAIHGNAPNTLLQSFADNCQRLINIKDDKTLLLDDLYTILGTVQRPGTLGALEQELAQTLASKCTWFSKKRAPDAIMQDINASLSQLIHIINKVFPGLRPSRIEPIAKEHVAQSITNMQIACENLMDAKKSNDIPRAESNATYLISVASALQASATASAANVA